MIGAETVRQIFLERPVSEELEKMFKESKYNRGELFEKMITEASGKEWKKDNKKFTNDGDITINGIKYQIKYNKGTFTNIATLANL